MGEIFKVYNEKKNHKILLIFFLDESISIQASDYGVWPV